MELDNSNINFEKYFDSNNNVPSHVLNIIKDKVINK